MRLPRLPRTPTVPTEVSSLVDLGRGERVLAAAHDVDRGEWLVATTYAVSLLSPDIVTEGGSPVRWRRPWHDVDRGSWEGESSTLTISWADGRPPSRWHLGEEAVFLQVLRERVQASVVLVDELKLSGRRTGRAVIRADLATGDLLEQVVLGRGVPADAEVELAAAESFVRLREQVGLTS